ncbi:MAG: beta-galactosidase trimerization domain-containing protein [Isosphaeraceae bacterium]
MIIKRNWYQHAFRRIVVDTHIPDWDEAFLSAFDAKAFAERLVSARAQSVVAYGHSHAGLFLYPTKVGKPHAALKGRNLLGEVIRECHARDIAVVVYTSLIYDRWAADAHPEWRMIGADGKPVGAGGRHGLLCPNSPYRDYAREFAAEICRSFDMEGLRFDMTFWPTLCFCPHCSKRFATEVGGEIPRTIDWHDPRWVAFQRCRERWLAEFARSITDTVRGLAPEVSVEHQSSTYPLNWMFGVTAALVPQNDFLQGDFYGDALQGSFVRKLLEKLTPHRPFGYETSVKLELKNHTALKPEPLLEAKAASAIADAAAFIVIDGIDPIGTVDPRPYARMGRVFGKLLPYYDHIGGERAVDVAVYYSLESKYNPSVGPRPVSNPDTSDAHTEAAMQAARRLIGDHRLFGVVTRKDLDRLDAIQALILPNVFVMSDEEAEAIRSWVRAGGTLYASGGTSLVDPAGHLRPDFALADVFGVTLRKADWSPREHYVAPTAAAGTLFGEFDATYPAFLAGYGCEVAARPKAEVLATTTLPWPAPDPSKFASIHSNPPWVKTDRPEVVLNRFGSGTAIYCASVLEVVPELAPVFLALLAPAGPGRLSLEAPECVEATLFHQADRHRYVLSLVNFQAQLPNIPIDGIPARLRLGGTRVRTVRLLPDGRDLPFETGADGSVVFRVPRLETLAMVAIEVV